MSQVPRWFERKFELSFPAEMYPNLCARLRGTPARLEELVRSISHETLVRKAGDNWSAQENAGHLFDLEALWLARVEDYVNGAETLTATDLANLKTTEANYNARRIEDILADFRQARNKLMQRLEGLETNLYSRTALHPGSRRPCGSWTIYISLPNTMTIIWFVSGSWHDHGINPRVDPRKSAS